MLSIPGQVKTTNLIPRKRNIPQLRQMGFQEINIRKLKGFRTSPKSKAVIPIKK